MKIYEFDGDTFDSLSTFFERFGEMVNGPGGYFGRNTDAFDDCFFGGFGLENPCVIVWRNAHASQKVLNHACKEQWCRDHLERQAYPDDEGLASLIAAREESSEGIGPTMFDTLVEGISTVTERSAGRNVVELKLEGLAPSPQAHSHARTEAE